LRLTLKSGETFGIVRKMLGQKLQSNIALQLGIVRTKDDTHPSLTQR
jgi:hypothetical protein